MSMRTEEKTLLITTQAVDINDPILGFFHGWLKEFSHHFKRIDVICLREGKHELPPHIRVYSLGKESGESRFKYVVRFYRYFIKLVLVQRVDYVFYHMGAVYNIMAAPFFFLRKLRGTKFFWWKAHGHINAAGKTALLFVDRVYTSTKSGFPIETTKRRIVGQAIDPQKFQLGNGARNSEVLFVGRITPIKRIEDFIETAFLLQDSFPNLMWKIIGPVDDHQYLKKLQDFTKEKGLEGRVIFCGTKLQDELVPIYQSAKIFLNTSRTESMDKTVLEAALCGCIPVTSNIAFKELLAGTHLFIEEGASTSYAKGIEKILSGEDESLRTELRNRVMESHSISTFTKRIFS